MENGIKVKTVMEIEVPGRRPVGRPKPDGLIGSGMIWRNSRSQEIHNREV